MPETNKDGLKVRTREDGVEVLDGAQKCAAFVHVHQMECEEDVVEFADGTPLDEVEETMATLAETLLSNCSEVGFGWYVPNESKQAKTKLEVVETPPEAVTLVRVPFKADPALVTQLEGVAQGLIQTLLAEREGDKAEKKMTCCDAMDALLQTQPKPANWRFCPFCGLTTADQAETFARWDTVEWEAKDEALVLDAGAFEAKIENETVTIEFTCPDNGLDEAQAKAVVFSTLMLLEAVL